MRLLGLKGISMILYIFCRTLGIRIHNIVDEEIRCREKEVQTGYNREY